MLHVLSGEDMEQWWVGVQTGRAPSAVCSLARLRLLETKGQMVTNVKKNSLPTKNKKKEKINTSTSNTEDRKAYMKKKKKNTRTTNSSQTFKTKKEKKNGSNKEVL